VSPPSRGSGQDGRGERVGLKHGAGGRAMRALIEEVFLPLGGPVDGVGLAAMDDGAALRLPGGGWLVVTTDSHVVQPAFFPGGDIGRLSICGTVNDLAMMGCVRPLGLTCAVIIEEGYPRELLLRARDSMKAACDEAGVTVITGDTKVMGKGELDGLVLNTTGVGIAERLVRDDGLRVGDQLIVTGTVADHGIAVLTARRDLRLEGDLRSDVAPLNGLVRLALEAGGEAVVAMKDPTRGGLASVLHEFAQKARVGVLLHGPAVPIRPETAAAAEVLGIDPLVVANEGKAVMGVRPEAAGRVLAALRAHPLGREAAIIGSAIAERPGQVILDTGFGKRILAETDGDPLPRIC